MKKGLGCLVALAVLAVFLIVSGAFYTVDQTEQVIITRFGKSIGEPIVTPGLKFKMPFLDKVNSVEKRILAWDGDATEMPTKDKTYIRVDTFARWRIEDPLTYLEQLQNERRAQSRINGILGSETRSVIAKHELIEVIRSTKDRTPQVSEEIAEADLTGSIGKLIPIRRGRSVLEEEIQTTAKTKLAEVGIELLDVRFKRVNYNEDVQKTIYERMISERQQIAERFRSEGAGEAAKILGDMERDLREIESEAYKIVETTKGEADAKATGIYALAFNQSDEAADFYEFMRTLELYSDVLGDSTLVLTTDSDLFKYLKSVKPVVVSSSEDADEAPVKKVPAPRAAPAPRN